MKHTMRMAILSLTLILSLVFGAMALAENVPAEPPVLEEAPAEEAPAEEAPAEEAPADDTAALQEALEALHAARQGKREADLAEELQGYVESGALTQAQADLILNEYKTRAEARAQGKNRREQMDNQRGSMPGQNPYGHPSGNDSQNNGSRGRRGMGGKGGMMPGSNVPNNNVPGNPGTAPQSAVVPEDSGI